MANTKWTVQKRRKFLVALAKTGNISQAARAASASRSHAYALKTGDPEFSVAWDDALEAAVDVLEGEARRRAVEGVETLHFHQGEVKESVRKYSDALLMFLLRAHRPETYRERADTAGARRHEQLEDQFGDARGDLERRLAQLDSVDGPDAAEDLSGAPVE